MLAIFLVKAATADEATSGRRARLQQLAEIHGFTLAHPERVDDGAVSKPTGDVRRQLRLLLDGYNFLENYGENGLIQSVLILGKSGGAPVPEKRTEHAAVASARPAQEAQSQRLSLDDGDTIQYRIPAILKNGLYTVRAMVIARAGAWQWVSMGVDFDGQAVVLPESMIEELDLQETLKQGSVPSMLGELQAKVGTLRRVTLGIAVSQNVTVAFVDDALLANQPLLGVGAISRFHIALDEGDHMLVLTPKVAEAQH